MARNPSFNVRVERPANELGTAMNEIRSWLDLNKIQPAGFKADTKAASVAFEINFVHEDEARRFESIFT